MSQILPIDIARELDRRWRRLFPIAGSRAIQNKTDAGDPVGGLRVNTIQTLRKHDDSVVCQVAEMNVPKRTAGSRRSQALSFEIMRLYAWPYRYLESAIPSGTRLANAFRKVQDSLGKEPVRNHLTGTHQADR